MQKPVPFQRFVTRASVLAVLALGGMSTPVAAATMDLVGGWDGTTQTMSHCGYLPTSFSEYTSSAEAVRVIQAKLQWLGYYSAAISGEFHADTQQAVQRFQRAYGLPITTGVNGATAQRLAYAAHPIAHVRQCTNTPRAILSSERFTHPMASDIPFAYQSHP